MPNATRAADAAIAATATEKPATETPVEPAVAPAAVDPAAHAAALERVAQLEAELATVTADRDAAAEQVRACAAAAEPLRLGPEVHMQDVTRLALRLVVATEAQAMLALAAARSGREASDLRAQAAVYPATTLDLR